MRIVRATATPAWIGVSLKTYFGPRATWEWCEDVRARLGSHPALLAGDVALVVLPSFIALPAASEIFAGTPILVGAQDLGSADPGPWTGEVPARDLVEVGARYVEVGHAERRRHFGETDAVVAAKVRAAIGSGLVPVLCVGEDAPLSADGAAAIVVRQVRRALADLGAPPASGLVLAYEPVWAIGQPAPASPEYVCEVLGEVRRSLGEVGDVTLVYGGSAGPGLLTQISAQVDGLFLGRFAHDSAALVRVVDEACRLGRSQASS